jgi:hypothetical protein
MVVVVAVAAAVGFDGLTRQAGPASGEFKCAVFRELRANCAHRTRESGRSTGDDHRVVGFCWPERRGILRRNRSSARAPTINRWPSLDHFSILVVGQSPNAMAAARKAAKMGAGRQYSGGRAAPGGASAGPRLRPPGLAGWCAWPLSFAADSIRYRMNRLSAPRGASVMPQSATNKPD